MAFLFRNTQPIELDEFTRDIEARKANIVPILFNNRFTDVVNTPGEVAGNHGDVRLSVLFLPIADRRFYQQVMAAGDDGTRTQELVDLIVREITP